MASLWSRLRSFLTTSGAGRKKSFRRRSPRGGRVLGAGCVERLESREMLTVTYHGGALLTHVEAQAVYMGSDWNTNSSLTTQTANLDSFVGYLVNSTYMDMLTTAGYGVGRGSATAGATLNVSLNKSLGISDTQIHTNLQSAISSGALATPDPQRLYVVYVEPGVVVKLGRDTSQNSFLGYHGAFAGHTAGGQAADIRYAVMPYPGTPNPSPGSQGYSNAFDELTSVSSHEIAEAVTDPDVNYKQLGWYDDQQNGEIGDLTGQEQRLNGFLIQDLVGKNDQVITPAPDTGGGGGGGGGGTTTLASPVISAASALSATSAQLTWTTVAGATGYRIQLLQGSTWTTAGTVSAGTTSATVTGLTAGANVSLRVEAFNNTQTAGSDAVSIQLPTPSSLTAPQVTATAIAATKAQLSWNAVAGAQSYRIYWWNGFRAVLLGTVGSSRTSVTITGLRAGSTNQFLVEAVGNGQVADSAWVSATQPSRTTTGRRSVTFG